jgi:hypothetical protein
VPAGVFYRDQIVAAMSKGGFQSEAVTDVRAIPMTDDIGLVTYRAVFPNRGEVFVSTLYHRIDGTWRGVFYQQTPLTRA